MVNIKITESDRSFQSKVNKALSTEINASLMGMASKIENQVRPIIEGALLASPEIASLSNGVLKAEFGLTFDPTSQLVSAIASSIDVNVNKLDSNMKGGGVTLTVQPTDYSNLLSLSIAEQDIEGGSTIPWLDWLLTLGDSIVIASFGVEFGNHGRTGLARMAEGFAPYKVNSAFSGTRDDNFITRAVARVLPEIKQVIVRAI